MYGLYIWLFEFRVTYVHGLGLCKISFQKTDDQVLAQGRAAILVYRSGFSPKLSLCFSPGYITFNATSVGYETSKDRDHFLYSRSNARLNI